MLDPHRGVLEDLGEEVAVGVSVDPGGAEPRLDVLHPEVCRQHALQRRDVHRHPSSCSAPARAASSLTRTFPDRYSLAGTSRSSAGSW